MVKCEPRLQAAPSVIPPDEAQGGYVMDSEEEEEAFMEDMMGELHAEPIEEEEEECYSQAD